MTALLTATPNACDVDDCNRAARSQKPGALCGTHYERVRVTGTTDREPHLPSAPLRAFVARRGIELPPSKLAGHTVLLSTADALCCDVLGVHPFDVYGEAYFTAA